MKNKMFALLLIAMLLILAGSQSCQKEIEFVENGEDEISLKTNMGGEVVNLSPLEKLGKNIFFEKISVPNNMSCATCHSPEYGFTGPRVGMNIQSGIYKGAVAQRAGNRKPPSAAYATFSPLFHFDNDEPGDEGLFEGGNFWDGRATGMSLGNPAADQAIGPFLNPLEQNHPSPQSVLQQIASSKFASLWTQVWKEPIDYSSPEKTALNYGRVGLSIAAYEASAEVNQFTSKYDYYLKGMVELTADEMAGLQLFNGKANCSACHPSQPDDDVMLPLFTDFTFDNLGTPKNPDNPFYDMINVYINGNAINPQGSAWIDEGLGGFLKSTQEWSSMADENMGKHKVPTLRNVDKRPGPGATKAYMHNGVFKSLKEVVHFYNTRDVKNWPAPEVAENVNRDELGNLGLTEKEENQLVAFMQTLSDGYIVKKGN
jgi:cytochrome c peroxidase